MAELQSWWNKPYRLWNNNSAPSQAVLTAHPRKVLKTTQKVLVARGHALIWQHKKGRDLPRVCLYLCNKNGDLPPRQWLYLYKKDWDLTQRSCQTVRASLQTEPQLGKDSWNLDSSTTIQRQCWLLDINCSELLVESGLNALKTPKRKCWYPPPGVSRQLLRTMFCAPIYSLHSCAGARLSLSQVLLLMYSLLRNPYALWQYSPSMIIKDYFAITVLASFRWNDLDAQIISSRKFFFKVFFEGRIELTPRCDEVGFSVVWWMSPLTNSSIREFCPRIRPGENSYKKWGGGRALAILKGQSHEIFHLHFF